MLDKSDLAAIGELIDQKVKPLKEAIVTLDKKATILDQKIVTLDQKVDRHTEESKKAHEEIIEMLLDIGEVNYQDINNRLENLDERTTEVEKHLRTS